MKKCPYCAEEIQDDAKKCRYCHEWIKKELEILSSKNLENKRTKEENKRFIFWKVYICSSAFLVVVFSFLGWIFDEFKDNFISDLLWIAFLSLLVGVLMTYAIRGITQVPKLTTEESSKYKGLTGWLILVLIGLGYGFGSGVFNIFSAEDNIDKICNGIFSMFVAYVMYLFITEKRRFKGFFIALLVINFLISASIFSLANDEIDVTKQFFRSLISLIIWVPYVIRSKRVRATFIN